MEICSGNTSGRRNRQTATDIHEYLISPRTRKTPIRIGPGSFELHPDRFIPGPAFQSISVGVSDQGVVSTVAVEGIAPGSAVEKVGVSITIEGIDKARANNIGRR